MVRARSLAAASRSSATQFAGPAEKKAAAKTIRATLLGPSIHEPPKSRSKTVADSGRLRVQDAGWRLLVRDKAYPLVMPSGEGARRGRGGSSTERRRVWLEQRAEGEQPYGEHAGREAARRLQRKRCADQDSWRGTKK